MTYEARVTIVPARPFGHVDMQRNLEAHQL